MVNEHIRVGMVVQNQDGDYCVVTLVERQKVWGRWGNTLQNARTYKGQETRGLQYDTRPCKPVSFEEMVLYG